MQDYAVPLSSRLWELEVIYDRFIVMIRTIIASTTSPTSQLPPHLPPQLLSQLPTTSSISLPPQIREVIVTPNYAVPIVTIAPECTNLYSTPSASPVTMTTTPPPTTSPPSPRLKSEPTFQPYRQPPHVLTEQSPIITSHRLKSFMMSDILSEPFSTDICSSCQFHGDIDPRGQS